jgi:iron(III) transport system substrate-binding protein
MLKRGIIVLALVAIVAVPFVLRPKQASPEQADDTLVIITPHNEAIRHEFSVGFRAWYRAKTGRTVFLDWRNVGGTSDIARYLDGQYDASFQNLWTSKPGRAWSADIEAGYKNGRLPADAPAVVREARGEFLGSEAGCGIDLFFGGGPYDFGGQARAGRLVDSGIVSMHPDWFGDGVIPRTYGASSTGTRTTSGSGPSSAATASSSIGTPSSGSGSTVSRTPGPTSPTRGSWASSAFVTQRRAAR